MGIDQSKVDALLAHAGREVDDGLLPSTQVALAYQGELVAFEAYGDADLDTRYTAFSATKAFVASTMWTLIGEGLVDPSKLVIEYIPEFGTNGKDVITVEQVMLHTSGFPHAPLGASPIGRTREGRVKRFGEWRLNWEPGTRYGTTRRRAHWVLAGVVDRVTGGDFRDELERRVTGPIGLPHVLGIPEDEQENVAMLEPVGEVATPDELEATFGIRELPVTEVTEEALLGFNNPKVKALGVPGGGGLMRAADLALFYQALLHNPGGVWKPDVLADVTTNVRNRLPDPLTNTPTNRSLGLILAGDDGRSHIRGMGRTVSPGTFGHDGAGGQLAWADPATGLSSGTARTASTRTPVHEPRHGTALSSLAAVCTT